MLASIGWTLVYWEHVLQAIVSGLAAIFAPLLPHSLKPGGSTLMAWWVSCMKRCPLIHRILQKSRVKPNIDCCNRKRCARYSVQVVSPKMILKMIPAVGGWIQMRMETIDTIFHQSFVFRLLWYLKQHA